MQAAFCMDLSQWLGQGPQEIEAGGDGGIVPAPREVRVLLRGKGRWKELWGGKGT